MNKKSTPQELQDFWDEQLALSVIEMDYDIIKELCFVNDIKLEMSRKEYVEQAMENWRQLHKKSL